MALPLLLQLKVGSLIVNRILGWRFWSNWTYVFKIRKYHFRTNSIRGHCLCQLEAFVSVFPWLLDERIQSHDVLRAFKCGQIYLVHDNEL